MAYKNGPMISPDIFREFMLPQYKKLTGFFKEYGIKNFFVDTDGNYEKLIPLFLGGYHRDISNRSASRNGCCGLEEEIPKVTDDGWN